MDPNACINLLLESTDHEERDELLCALHEWIDSGGFIPRGPKEHTTLLDFKAHSRSAFLSSITSERRANIEAAISELGKDPSCPPYRLSDALRIRKHTLQGTE